MRSIKKFKAMKKITSLFAIAIAASSLLQGCEEPVTPPEKPLELSEVILDREEAVMQRGETLVLS